jgi:hypothetical protein
VGRPARRVGALAAAQVLTVPARATDFPQARVVRLPAGGTPRLDLTAPAPVPIN